MQRNVLGPGIMVLLLLGGLVYVLSGLAGESGRDARGDLIAEVQQWERWDEFNGMLMAVIDAEHEGVFDQNYERGHRSRPSRFDETSYRAMMYMAMRQALSEAGHRQASVDLDQYRVRARRRR